MALNVKIRNSRKLVVVLQLQALVMCEASYTISNLTSSLFHHGRTVAFVETKSNLEEIVACQLYNINGMKKEDFTDGWNKVQQENPSKELSLEQMIRLIFKCKDVDREPFDVDLHHLTTAHEQALVSLNFGLVPNTRWCGKGRNTPKYHELGSHTELDKCCRAHDHCPSYLAPFTSKNPNAYTLSHCLCDEMFRQCLKKSLSVVADAIGVFFFNIFKLKCFTFGENNCSSAWCLPTRKGKDMSDVQIRHSEKY